MQKIRLYFLESFLHFLGSKMDATALPHHTAPRFLQQLFPDLQTGICPDFQKNKSLTIFGQALVFMCAW